MYYSNYRYTCTHIHTHVFITGITVITGLYTGNQTCTYIQKHIYYRYYSNYRYIYSINVHVCCIANVIPAEVAPCKINIHMSG